jgi:hypothetical protein
MSNPYIQAFLDSKISMLLVVEEILNDWKGDGCRQLPAMLGQIQVKMGWSDKQLRANDPIIREYIRTHTEWDVTRGAHGGIMRAADKQKKAGLIEAKRKAKEEINIALDAEVARKIAEASATIVEPVVVVTIDSE